MNQGSVLAFLHALGAERVKTNGDWVLCSCPLAPWTHTSGKDSHPSFAIKCNIPESFFNCFSCEHGDLYYLLQRISNLGGGGKYNIKEALKYVMAEQDQDLVLTIKNFGEPSDVEVEVLYTESWLNSFMPAENFEQAVSYLEGRAVGAALRTRFDIRFDSQRQCVCIPIRNFKGQLMGLRGRYINPDPDGPPYHVYKTNDGKHNKLPWFNEHAVDFEKPVLMVESVFDLFSVVRVYENVVAPLSVGMSAPKVKRMGAATEIVTLFDQGKGGDKARDLISKHLSHGRLITHLIPTQEDPGEMSVEELRAQLEPVLPLHI